MSSRPHRSWFFIPRSQVRFLPGPTRHHLRTRARASLRRRLRAGASTRPPRRTRLLGRSGRGRHSARDYPGRSRDPPARALPAPPRSDLLPQRSPASRRSRRAGRRIPPDGSDLRARPPALCSRGRAPRPARRPRPREPSRRGPRETLAHQLSPNSRASATTRSCVSRASRGFPSFRAMNASLLSAYIVCRRSPSCSQRARLSSAEAFASSSCPRLSCAPESRSRAAAIRLVSPSSRKSASDSSSIIATLA